VGRWVRGGEVGGWGVGRGAGDKKHNFKVKTVRLAQGITD